MGLNNSQFIKQEIDEAINIFNQLQAKDIDVNSARERIYELLSMHEGEELALEYYPMGQDKVVSVFPPIDPNNLTIGYHNDIILHIGYVVDPSNLNHIRFLNITLIPGPNGKALISNYYTTAGINKMDMILPSDDLKILTKVSRI